MNSLSVLVGIGVGALACMVVAVVWIAFVARTIKKAQGQLLLSDVLVTVVTFMFVGAVLGGAVAWAGGNLLFVIITCVVIGLLLIVWSRYVNKQSRASQP